MNNFFKSFALDWRCLFNTFPYCYGLISDKEPGVVILDEDGRPEDRIEDALNCLPNYDPAACWGNSSFPFRYWKIRDYAYAYRSGKVTPSMVSGIHLLRTSFLFYSFITILQMNYSALFI